MNTNRIKELIESKTTIKKAAKFIGMSEGGFHTSLTNNTIKVNTLEKLSDFLEIDIREFFIDFSNVTYVSEQQASYGKKRINKNVSNNENTISKLIKIIELKEKKEVDLVQIIKNQSERLK